jgi:hypothetical protein
LNSTVLIVNIGSFWLQFGEIPILAGELTDFSLKSPWKMATSASRLARPSPAGRSSPARRVGGCRKRWSTDRLPGRTLPHSWLDEAFRGLVWWCFFNIMVDENHSFSWKLFPWIIIVDKLMTSWWLWFLGISIHLAVSEVMGDPQVTMGFNTKVIIVIHDLDDLGYHIFGHLQMLRLVLEHSSNGVIIVSWQE